MLELTEIFLDLNPIEFSEVSTSVMLGSFNPQRPDDRDHLSIDSDI